MAGVMNDADLIDDFHRIQVKLSESIHEDSDRGSYTNSECCLRGIPNNAYIGRLMEGQMAYYVVFEGRVPGVYEEWEDCKKQVHKFSDNCYRGYPPRHEMVAKWRNHQ
ncbi:hypothetical protein QYE76_062242 [Lolium multiflorum]|uniref:Ribonuclease H1 N-terminal domain-containing protein n=1 Tax=Lolium multiflorum TaxID=4521 RepID=A0AAD8S2U4_LOLMU|nr:hypothetical protein QYE76_062242 [Lolium multiflorum]